MQFPLQITFRNMEPSAALEQTIREKADKLTRYHPRITSCSVVVEAPHRHHHKGKIFHVHIHLHVPQGELVVSRDPHKNHTHEDAYIAVRDAFEAARKQLDSFVKKQRGEVKTHDAPHDVGEVVALHPDEDHGFIRTQEGREIYFHRNSMTTSSFSELNIGVIVKFIEQMGDKGPQASYVSVLEQVEQ